MDRTDWTVDDYIADIRWHGEMARAQQMMRLNVIVASTLYYDIPWLNYEMSEALDVVKIQERCLAIGPNPAGKK